MKHRVVQSLKERLAIGITRSLTTSPSRDKEESESFYGSSERKKHSRLSKLSST